MPALHTRRPISRPCVSARSADVSLNYPGGAERLADAMAAKGLALRNEGGAWVLRPRF